MHKSRSANAPEGPVCEDWGLLLHILCSLHCPRKWMLALISTYECEDLVYDTASTSLKQLRSQPVRAGSEQGSEVDHDKPNFVIMKSVSGYISA